jgi:hypothetical protein
VRPPVQVVPQTLLEQVWPLGQTLLHLPQSELLEVVSTQALLLQRVSLLGQVVLQVPLEQPWPELQA